MDPLVLSRFLAKLLLLLLLYEFQIGKQVQLPSHLLIITVLPTLAWSRARMASLPDEHNDVDLSWVERLAPA